jgi:thymidylate synthase (FAD)
MSVNFRELIHLCNLRLCTRAQKEIRDLFGLIVKEVKGVDERLASYLVPQCEIHGICFEDKCCGRKPKFKESLK